MKRILKNSFMKIILTICNIAIPLIVMPYVLRIISRESYDTYNAITVNVQLFLTLGAFGIYNYGIREIAKVRKNHKDTKTLMSELFFINIISNSFFAIIYFAILYFMQNNRFENLIYIILGFQFLANYLNLEWMNEAKENYSFITIKSILIKIVYLILNFALVKTQNDFTVFVLIFVASQVLNMLASFIFVVKKNGITVHGLNLMRHLKSLTYVFLISNIALLYMTASKFVLGNFVAEKHVTIFQVPYTITSMVYTVFVSVAIVSIPKLSSLNNNEAELINIYKKISNIFLLMFIPCCIGMILLSKEIMLAYGGEKYTDCILSLILFSIFHYISGKCYLLNDCFLFVRGKEKVVLVNNILGGSFNIMCMLLLLSFNVYNAYSAIIVLIISYVIVYFLSFAYVKKNNTNFNISFLSLDEVASIVASLFFIPIVLIIKSVFSNVLLVLGMSILMCAVFYFLCISVFYKKKYNISFLSLAGLLRKKNND